MVYIQGLRVTGRAEPAWEQAGLNPEF